MKQRLILFICCLSILMCAGCGSSRTAGAVLSVSETYDKADPDDLAVSDTGTLYESLDRGSVTVAYLAVAAYGDYTWSELNSRSLDEQGDTPYQCSGLLQFGDEIGPLAGMFGYEELSANVTVRLQGESASTRQQKSYRIEISDGQGKYNGMTSLILSKSFTDPYRISEMLSRSLMQEIPSLLSTRTQLVHLYVKDTASETTAYQDYGLYTLIEPVNKSWMKSRSLDTYGSLYKAENFDFERHEDVIMRSDDMNYDADAFEEILEIKCGDDHSALIAMLDAVADETITGKELADTYFDADNLYDYLAFNLLLGNTGCSTSDYYLYSPSDSSRFYFISWDCDSILRENYELLKDEDYTAGWNTGIYSWYDNALFRRIIQDEDCRDELSAHLAALYEDVLSPEHVAETAQDLAALAEDYIYALPDRTFARVTQEEYETLVNGIADEVTANYYAYYDSLDGASPFHIACPTVSGRSTVFTWSASECLAGDVTYDIAVSDKWSFSDIITSANGLTDTEYTYSSALAAGQYFVRVTAHAPNGTDQTAYEYYNTETKATVPGVLCFYVRSDGSTDAAYFTD